MCFHFSSVISSPQSEEEDLLMSDQITNCRVLHACAYDAFFWFFLYHMQYLSHYLQGLCVIIISFKYGNQSE